MDFSVFLPASEWNEMIKISLTYPFFESKIEIVTKMEGTELFGLCFENLWLNPNLFS